MQMEWNGLMCPGALLQYLVLMMPMRFCAMQLIPTLPLRGPSTVRCPWPLLGDSKWEAEGQPHPVTAPPSGHSSTATPMPCKSILLSLYFQDA